MLAAVTIPPHAKPKERIYEMPTKKECFNKHHSALCSGTAAYLRYMSVGSDASIDVCSYETGLQQTAELKDLVKSIVPAIVGRDLYRHFKQWPTERKNV